MPWKMNGENVALQDGHPVWINEDNSEIPADFGRAMTKIGDLQKESKSHRESFEALDKRWKALPELVTSDPEAVIKALDTVKNLGDKKLIEAGEAQRVRDEAVQEANKLLKAEQDKNTALQGTLDQTIKVNALATSKFLQEHVRLSPQSALSLFGDAIRIVEGKPLFHKGDSPIGSRKTFGEAADFDEGLQIFIEGHPDKENLLFASPSGGSGAQPPLGRGKGFVLSEAEARDPQRYRAMKEQAEKAGQPLTIQRSA